MKSKNIFVLIIIIFAIIGFVFGINYALDYFHVILSWKDWLIISLCALLIFVIFLLFSGLKIASEVMNDVFKFK